MSEARLRPKTRERVLEVALSLFNTRGVTRVTTAEIAEAAGINEGNLYYYFQRKEHLAEALFAQLEAAMLAVADASLGDPAEPASYAVYQRGWFGLMWDFRCFYRDGRALPNMAPALRERLRALNLHGQASVCRIFQRMNAHGLLAATDEEVDILIGNLWIVSAYWMDFRLMETQREVVSDDDMAWGFRQVNALVWPYLTARGREIGTF